MSELPATSNAVIINSYGESSVLNYTTVTTPTLKPDDDAVIIKVKAAGVNPVDYKVRKGQLAALLSLKFPAILGIDYSGTVVAVGPKAVGGFKVGDEVYGKKQGVKGDGTYAEYVRVSTTVDLVVKRPDHLPFDQAAGIGVVALTAYVGLVTYGGLSATEPSINTSKKVLVLGASGGVGSYGVLIAKLLGANVTAVASARNEKYVTETLKADRFVDYTKADLAQQLTTENEFDVILDGVGGDSYWQLAQKILKPNGFFSTAAGNQHPDENHQIGVGDVVGMLGGVVWKKLTSSRNYKFISSLPVPEFSKHLSGWFESGQLKALPVVTKPLKEAAAAHDESATHRVVGKIVLIP